MCDIKQCEDIENRFGEKKWQRYSHKLFSLSYFVFIADAEEKHSVFLCIACVVLFSGMYATGSPEFINDTGDNIRFYRVSLCRFSFFFFSLFGYIAARQSHKHRRQTNVLMGIGIFRDIYFFFFCWSLIIRWRACEPIWQCRTNCKQSHSILKGETVHWCSILLYIFQRLCHCLGWAEYKAAIQPHTYCIVEPHTALCQRQRR